MIPKDTTAAVLLKLARDMKMRITARDLSSVSGPMADLLKMVRSGQIVDLDKPRIILQDTTAQAADLLSLRKAAGPSLVLGRLKTIQGRLADVLNLYGAPPIKGLANQAIVLTDSVVSEQSLALLRTRAKGPIDRSRVLVRTGATSPQTRLVAIDPVLGDGGFPPIAFGDLGSPALPWLDVCAPLGGSFCGDAL